MAQLAVPPLGATPFKDTSMLKPPVGAKIAIIEFEYLECYACGQASSIVWSAMEQYKIPRIHHDFIIQRHAWSRAAAIDARYLEYKVSPKAAEDFRHDVFAHSLESPVLTTCRTLARCGSNPTTFRYPLFLTLLDGVRKKFNRTACLVSGSAYTNSNHHCCYG